MCIKVYFKLMFLWVQMHSESIIFLFPCPMFSALKSYLSSFSFFVALNYFISIFITFVFFHTPFIGSWSLLYICFYLWDFFSFIVSSVWKKKKTVEINLFDMYCKSGLVVTNCLQLLLFLSLSFWLIILPGRIFLFVIFSF